MNELGERPRRRRCLFLAALGAGYVLALLDAGAMQARSCASVSVLVAMLPPFGYASGYTNDMR